MAQHVMIIGRPMDNNCVLVSEDKRISDEIVQDMKLMISGINERSTELKVASITMLNELSKRGFEIVSSCATKEGNLAHILVNNGS